VEEALSLLERPVDDYDATDNDLFKPILNHVTMRTAVSEVWELGNYVLLKLLGPVHNDDVTYIMNYVLKWVESGTIIDHMKITKVRDVVTSLVELVDVIGKGIGRRKPAANRRSTGQKKKAQEPAGPPASGIRRSISASTMTTTDSAPSARNARNTITGFGMKSTADENLVIIDALRDLTRDKFRAFLNSLKSIMISSNPESKDIMDRLTFALSMENGFFWDDAYASDSLDDMARSEVCKSVLTKLQGVVACHPDEVEPKSKEVRRRLVSSIHFFLRVVH
jgi:callose synthase